VIVALALMCRSSYLGIIEFMRDVLAWPISIGTIHNVLHAAAQQAGVINRAQDLSCIRTGLHDELFHGAKPVLAGVCTESTYCYLLSGEEHRDVDTWGVHLLDAAHRDRTLNIPSPMPGRACAPGRKPPGATRRAMAMSSTSSTNAKASPIRSRASPRAPDRGAKSWTPRSAAPVRSPRRTRSSPSWCWHGKPKPGRVNWPAVFVPSSNG
jgi:hypothetical protein